MRFLKLNICISLFVMTLLCIPSLVYAKAEERIEETYQLDRDGKVYLENVSGDIVVKSWGKSEVAIVARKVARKKKDLDKVSIDINQTNGNIRIMTRHHKSFGLFHSTNVSVYYDLFIPDKAQIRVKSVSGRAEALEIGGLTDIETVSGKIEITSAKSGVKCRTISGDIYLEKIIGDADLKSTSGEIIAEGVKGSVETNTVSGDVELKNISLAEEIEVESISGSIEIHAELSPGGIYELNTISGRIRLALPAISNFELQTETTSGDIQCDFELKMSGKIARKKIQGVVGKGGSTLKISSVSGDILISKRK